MDVTSFLEGPAIPGSLRQINRLIILRMLRQHGPVTKPILGQYSGISRPTVSKLVDELEEHGLAECVGVTSPTASGGKPGALYRFNAEGVQSGAIFLSVDTAYLAVVNGNGRVLGSIERSLGPDRRPEPIIALVTDGIQELLSLLHISKHQLLGIGVGVPGLTSFQTGYVHYAPHFPEWHEVPLRDLLKARLEGEVWVDNDCHVQALAERHFGAGQNCSDFVTVKSGIGVSAAFYLQDTLYRGRGETAGEIGHMTVQDDGPLCECGNHGCWETLASTTWMVEQAYTRIHQDRLQSEGVILPRRLDKGEQLEPQTIKALANTLFRLANEGEPEAMLLVRQHANHFGTGVASIVNTLNPQRIIIWGDSVSGSDLFLETVRTVVQQRALHSPREQCEIVLSSLTLNGGVIGAASLAIDALFTNYQPVS